MDEAERKGKRKPRRRGEMKRVSAAEHPTVVGIPLVVGVAIVRVEPDAVLVAFDVKHIEVAIGISERALRHLRHHPSNTLWIESNPESPHWVIL